MARWNSHGPTLRNDVLDVMLSHPQWTRQFLEHVRENRRVIADIDATRRQLLRDHPDGVVREVANAIFAEKVDSSREQIVASYRDGLDRPGNLERGRAVFQKQCSVCHRLENSGHDIGPNLAGLTNKTPASLLVDILDPNRAVDARYRNYIAIEHDGRTFSGIVTAETSTNVTLTAQEGKQRVIRRSDLEEFQALSTSMMPEGLEKEIDIQAMRDLLAYLDNVNPRREAP